MSNKRWSRYLSIALFMSTQGYAAQIMQGDVADGTQSFTFPVRAHAYHPQTGRFFIAADKAQESNTFAIAAAIENTQFFGLAPAQVTLNNLADQANPLIGAHIKHLALMGEHPIVVKSDQENVVYCIAHYKDLAKIYVISSQALPDATGAVSAGVVGLSSNSTESLTPDFSQFFAAVKNNAGEFGEPGSGIAGGSFKIEKKTDNNILSFAPTKTLALDKTSVAIKINNDATSFNNVAYNKSVDMHWSDRFKTLYSALLVTGGAGTTDGVRGIVRGNVEIAPAAAFTANSIVGGVGASLQVSMHCVRTMVTSTLLDYLIVVGGVGAPADTKRMVFALPLVNNDTSKFFGVLAKKDALPIDRCSDSAPYRFQARVLSEPALVVGDLFEPTDTPAIVGGTGILPGDITEVHVHNDTVFVSVATEGTEKSGIFYSQALFDAVGKIKGWTVWQRASGSTDHIFGFALNNYNGNFWLMPGADAETINTVKRTAWGLGNGDLTSVVNNYFPPENGGVHSIVDQKMGNYSVLIVTGFKKIMLVPNGSPPIKISGGVLDSLGAITAATIVNDGNYSWLFVAGSGGLAVLAHDDGTGSRSVLDAGMKFKKIGDYKNVRRIIADTNNLYILTANKLDRISVSGGLLPAVTIARADRLPVVHGSFSDIAVSGAFGLLATSGGLLRVGNNGDISTAHNADSINWTSVTLPESVGPVTRIVPISPTGQEHEFATHDNGGNIYILNAYVGYHQARVYRFTVKNITNTLVDDSTLTLFPDYFVKDKKSFYLNVGDYRNYLATDGALFFLSRSAYAPTKAAPFLEVLRPDLFHAQRLSARTSTKVLEIEKATSIGRLLRRSATGSWLISGDFGLQVNE